MDYDKTDIPAAYNRGRDHGPAFLEQWMNAVASHVEPAAIRDVLDLGSGTGRFSRGLAERFNATVVGIDPSKKMLAQARSSLNHERVFYACAGAEALPLRSKSMDLIFISMVFHHLTSPQMAAQECSRVLREHGHVCLRTASREMISRYPYVPFFPASRTLLEQRLPTLAVQRNVFEEAGFVTIFSELVTQEVAPDYFSYADKLSAKADSILVDLDDAEFESGIHALRSITPTMANCVVTEPIDLLVFSKK